MKNNNLSPTLGPSKNVVLLEKTFIYLIINTLLSFTLYPNLWFNFAITEILCFMALCPTPNVKKLGKFKDFIPYIIGVICVPIAFLSIKISLMAVLSVIFSILTGLSLKYISRGIQWAGMVFAPAISLICMEICKINSADYIFATIKGYTANPSEYIPNMLALWCSATLLYFIISLMSFLVKEKNKAFSAFGILVAIVSTLNVISYIFVKQPFVFSNFKIIYDTIRLTEDWGDTFKPANLPMAGIICVVAFCVLYFPIMRLLSGPRDYTIKKERAIKLFVSVFILVSVILLMKFREGTFEYLSGNGSSTWFLELLKPIMVTN